MNDRPALTDQGLPERYFLKEEWELTPRNVKAMLDAGEDFVLIDCRMEQEYQLVHIAGSTLHILQKIGDDLPDLVDDYADKKVVCYCHHGARSMQMTAILRDAGVPDTWSMAGGIDLWAIDIEPGMVRY
ncbi:MAG TPA: rhodanese [Phycisphaerales bacterium]|nr:rhodanese [Phycisphaerales bacterium]|tara:strand:+ start:2203 stop:2589 length:387 start_codon:yes stop_codon:yes gene_type:complete